MTVVVTPNFLQRSVSWPWIVAGFVLVVIPEIETFHDYYNVMRQYCPNGALIELDRNDGSGQVIFKGETVKTYEHVMVADINQIQAFASALR